MPYVKPKKHLGQHFLKDQQVAKAIVSAFRDGKDDLPILEIGPGTGVLTSLLLAQVKVPFKVIEIDKESVAYLENELGINQNQIIEADFLKIESDTIFPNKFNVIGNLPYNISSQIFFKVLENKEQINRVTCMIQKEVADRIATQKGGRTAGILTILVQAFYDVKHEFDVPPKVFIPPPKVDSSVISLQRNQTKELDCNEKLFFKVVKQAFAMRRKTLKNNMKIFMLPDEITSNEIFTKRAEALTVSDFVSLTNIVEAHSNN